MSSDEVSPHVYNVTVDFHCSKKSTNELADEFLGAQHFEGIGKNQHQVGLGVAAPNTGEAYRRAVEYVEATLSLANVTGPAILGANVHGPDGETVFD